MQDASPRIFRSLEHETGRDGFDMIVRAALANYSALRKPTEAQAQHFGRLVEPVWSRLSDETRRMLAASLASSPLVPRGIVERLIVSPIEISAPFLATSDALTADDLAALEIAGDARMVRLLRLRASARDALARSSQERRSAEAESEAAAPPSAPTNAAPEPIPADSAAPSAGASTAPESLGAPAAESPAVTQARETLRRLARPRPPVRPTTSGEATKGDRIEDLKALAAAGQSEAVFASLDAWLDLSPAASAVMRDEVSGHALAMVLKAAGFGRGDAMTVLMMVKPAVGLDLVAFETMSTLYASLNEDECRRRFAPAAPARQRRIAQVPPLSPRAEELRPLDRVPAQRPRFGRRREAPTDKSDRSAG